MKARLRLIRHGEAAPALAGETDPGLSLRGVRQALGLPGALQGRPDRLITSPMARTRETALPIAGTFGLERTVELDYSEIPWREGQSAAERVAELNTTLRLTWPELDADWRAWRDRLIERALSETGDVVIVSHFVAINALVGFALADDRTVVAPFANASITELHVLGDRLSLVSLGEATAAFPDPHLAPARGPL